MSSFFLGWQIHPATGWGRYGTELALGLLRKGHSVVALANDAVEQQSLLQRARLAAVKDWRDLEKSFATLNVDVAILALGNNAIGVVLPEKINAKKTFAAIFFEDTHISPEMVATLNGFDGTIAGSTWNAELLEAAGVERVHVVIQGVNAADWHPAPKDPAFSGRFAIFSGGKLEFRKGQDIVVAAFRRFRAKHPEALLVTAWQNVFPETMQGIDLAGHVQGLPTINERGGADICGWLVKNGIPRSACIDVGMIANHAMPSIVRACDLAVFPNRAEGGTNLVAMECIAAGVTTAAVDATGQRDIAPWGCDMIPFGSHVPAGCDLYRGTEGWAEVSPDALVEVMERAYHGRGDVAALPRVRWSWEKTTRAIIDITSAAPALAIVK